MLGPKTSSLPRLMPWESRPIPGDGISEVQQLSPDFLLLHLKTLSVLPPPRSWDGAGGFWESAV